MKYRIWRGAVLFYLGGMLYCGIELLWRQWTHCSMFLLGGLCFSLLSLLERSTLPLLSQMVLGAAGVTFLEFWTGILVNQRLQLNVWDYSSLPLNLLGQICLPFSLLWFPLCGIGILCAKKLRYILFHENAPQLRWL